MIYGSSPWIASWTPPLGVVPNLAGAQVQFVMAWGGNVDASGATPDVCEDAANCQSGTKGAPGGQFNDPTGVAVDTNGNVYVADPSNHRIQKFRTDPN
jgi:DNA-binding beta-propeller fold protein YncE